MQQSLRLIYIYIYSLILKTWNDRERTNDGQSGQKAEKL